MTWIESAPKLNGLSNSIFHLQWWSRTTICCCCWQRRLACYWHMCYSRETQKNSVSFNNTRRINIDELELTRRGMADRLSKLRWEPSIRYKFTGKMWKSFLRFQVFRHLPHALVLNVVQDLRSMKIRWVLRWRQRGCFVANLTWYAQALQ